MVRPRRHGACRACGTHRGLGGSGSPWLCRPVSGSSSRGRFARCCHPGVRCGRIARPQQYRLPRLLRSGGRTAGGSSPGRCPSGLHLRPLPPHFARGSSGLGSGGPCIRSIGPGRARSPAAPAAGAQTPQLAATMENHRLCGACVTGALAGSSARRGGLWRAVP